MKNPKHIIMMLVVAQVITYASAIVLMRALAREKLRFKRLHDLTEYILHVAEDQGVDIGEFDLIAIKAISVAE